MAAVTISGSIGGIPLTFLASYSTQASIAASIFAATGAVVSYGGPLTSNNTADLGASGSIITGTSTFGTSQTTPAEIALGSNGTTGQSYYTGTAADSVVTAADNSGANIVNNNPFGNLVADTGRGPNILFGYAGGNVFNTGAGGQDQVILDGATNTLVSHGSDAVLVGGPSTITAATNGADNVIVTNATTLSFTNSNPGPVDSITGAAGGIINLVGTGSTSISASTMMGAEQFNIDTSAGNVTLNGMAQTSNTFEFVHDASTATGMVTVNNFASGDSVIVHNYASYNITSQAGNPAGSVLLLSDGSQVTFTNVTAAQLQQTVKPG